MRKIAQKELLNVIDWIEDETREFLCEIRAKNCKIAIFIRLV